MGDDSLKRTQSFALSLPYSKTDTLNYQKSIILHRVKRQWWGSTEEEEEQEEIESSGEGKKTHNSSQIFFIHVLTLNKASSF